MQKISDDLDNRLNYLAQLKYGWDSDDEDSQPINSEVITLAKKLLSNSSVHTFGQIDIGALPEGGIELCWYKVGCYLTIYNLDNKYDIYRSDKMLNYENSYADYNGFLQSVLEYLSL